jgi:hypothetical protein
MKKIKQLFLTIYGFQLQVLIVLSDTGIRTIKKRTLTKMKGCLTKKWAGAGIRRNVSRILGVRKHRIRICNTGLSDLN